MNRLLYGEITEGLPLPGFGPAFEDHIAAKTHPSVRSASLTAWSLLACALEQLGYETLPRVEFSEGGKPFFADAALHFSISHSSNMAAALVSDAPCAVDIERIIPETAAKLADRCLSEAEKELRIDFFEAWTRKECIVKLEGTGMPARPSSIDTLNPDYNGQFFSREIRDAQSNAYRLTALCQSCEEPKQGPEDF